MEARMCFEFSYGLADISKFYPLPPARDEILISANTMGTPVLNGTFDSTTRAALRYKDWKIITGNPGQI
jgi:hypothetical protein